MGPRRRRPGPRRRRRDRRHDVGRNGALAHRSHPRLRNWDLRRRVRNLEPWRRLSGPVRGDRHSLRSRVHGRRTGLPRAEPTAGPPPPSAALAALGPPARVMPVIRFHGDEDNTIPYRCGQQTLAQWLRTDDLILQHERRASLPSTPTISQAVVPGGRAYTVASYTERLGCPAAQLWTIHGMGHYWSGGSADPASARYTDPRGPSATASSWAFFSRWRLSGRLGPCARPGQ